MGLVEGLDPKDIRQSGWGLILPSDLDKRRSYDLIEALAPLLDRRKEQAGDAFRMFYGDNGVRPGESKTSFLNRHGVGPGPVDPERMPYYLLVVSDPKQISFRFQSQLDIQYAVGRVWFEDPQRLRAYAQSAARAEETSSAPPARLAFFCPQHPGDVFTHRMSSFIQTLARRAADGMPDWQTERPAPAQASKSELIELLKHQPPQILFSSGHSLVYPAGGGQQFADLGGLVCADWPGPVGWSGEIAESMCFRAVDVPDQADLSGMVYIQYSSYSMGTPGSEGASSAAFSSPALTSSLAGIPQRLLSLPEGRGALAVVGWTDQLWSYASPEQASRELAIFESCLQKLANGYPVGAAFEFFQERYAEISTDLSVVSEDLDFGKVLDEKHLADQWVGMNNARGLAIFGDPAARLQPAAAPPEEKAIDLSDWYPDTGAPSLATSPGDEYESVLDLEISLAPHPEPGLYRMEMRLSGSDVQEGRFSGDFRIDRDAFRYTDREVEEYGKRLFDSLFAQPEAGDFLQALDAYREQPVSFSPVERSARLRLKIDPEAGELHELAWETLFDPRRGQFMFASPELSFSRYLSAPDWRPLPPLRERGELRALAVISNPINVSDYTPNNLSLNVLDIGSEQARASMAMQDVPLEVLASDASRPGQVSAENLERQLRKGYDILYLVCHAARPEKAGLGLFLEGADGRVHVIRAEDFIQRLRHMRVERRPRLVVLVPPQAIPSAEFSGAITPAGALSGLAPLLCAAGVAAGLAVPEGLPPDVSGRYLQAFFRSLKEDGRVDRAAAAARQALYPRPGWWAPALYTRTPDGLLWLWGYEAPAAVEEGRFAELSLYLSRKGVADYASRLEFTWQDQISISSSDISLDFDVLRATSLDSQVYGSQLFKSIFRDDLLKLYLIARAAAPTRGGGLRLRLVIDRSAAELHELSWERLFDPQGNTYLAMDEELAFARYLFSTSWRAIDLRPSATLRALFAVANPADLPEYNLAPIDKAVFESMASNLEGKMAVHFLSGPVTLESLVAELRQGYDLLYLVCHGAMVKGESWLFLQRPDGTVGRVNGYDFSSMLGNLARQPRLVVLASSQSTPLAPRLCESGVPAALTMLGNVMVTTASRFSSVFLDELLEDGRADRAAAVARSAVSDEQDWWMPVLYTRLRDGRLWFQPAYK